MLWGPPGCGKSAMLISTAAKLGYGITDIRISQLDPVDLRGLPHIDRKTNTTQWANAGFLPADPDTKNFIIFEEITHGNDAQQAACFQLIHDRRCGDYVMPEGCIPFAASNRSEDFSIVNRMASALKNRFFHIEVMSSHEDWIPWAIKNGIHESVIGFINFRPAMLNEFMEVGDANRARALAEEIAFATERSWEMVSKLMHAGYHPDIEMGVISGTVGEAATAELAAYLRFYRDLPDLDKVLHDPKLLRIETITEPATLYAIATGIAVRVTNDPDILKKGFKIFSMMPPEYATMAIKTVIGQDNDIMDSDEFNKWAANNASFVSSA